MTDHNDYLRTSNGDFRLKADALALMLKGAGYAAIFCVALGITAWVMVGISNLLPEASKEADDPTPTSYLLAPDTSVRQA